MEERILIKLNVPWEFEGATYEKDAALLISKWKAEELIASKIGYLYDEEADKAAKDAQEARIAAENEMIRKAVTEGMAALTEKEKKTRPSITAVKPDADPTGGYNTFDQKDASANAKARGEFMMDVLNAGLARRTGRPLEQVAPRLARWDAQSRKMGLKVMSELTDAQLGFFVPTQFSTDWLQTALETAFLASRVRFIPMQTNRIEIPAVFDLTHYGAEPKTFFGAVKIYRVGEEAAKTASDVKGGTVQLNLHEVAGLARVTNSLIEDSPISIEALLGTSFGQAISWVFDNDILNGDGVGKPMGIMNCTAKIDVAKVSGQTGYTINLQNITDMWAAMPSQLRGNAIWVGNDAAFGQLMNLTVGTAVSAFIAPGGATGTAPAMLLGRPIFFTEKLPVVGEPGDLLFIDPTQYLLGGKNGLSIQTASSMHLYFDYDEMAYRFTLRYDGVCWWKTYLIGADNAHRSPFVGIAQRH
jgi:HK97 family phage major capsid protein